MAKYMKNKYGTEKSDDPLDPFIDSDYQELKDFALTEAVRATGGKRSAFIPTYDEENDDHYSF